MKTAFLGNFGARPGIWEAILAKTTEQLDTTVLFDLDDSPLQAADCGKENTSIKAGNSALARRLFSKAKLVNRSATFIATYGVDETKLTLSPY